MTEKERIREIDRQETELRQERHRLLETVIAKQQEKLRATVGLCFRLRNGDCVKIIDVPQKQEGRLGTYFNEYQLPVLKIVADDYDLIPFEEDTLFSHAVNCQDMEAQLRKEYEMITLEEFNAELEKRFQEIRELGTP